jgi:predicted HTH transcriptional regulator
MKAIEKILLILEQYIKDNIYHPVETDQLELKDLSGGDDWNELYKTICAFLNTKGGIIIIGVKEDIKNKYFKFTGFSSAQSTEEKIKNIPKLFTDRSGNQAELSDYINPGIIEIRRFLDGNVCLIFVENLPEDKKFAFYRGDAYERRLTSDHKIKDEKIQKQTELIEELRNAAELNLVPGAALDDFDVDKLNDYIIKLNSEKKAETLKPDIPSALSFLSRKRFIRGNNPTLLGMLVCGQYIFDHVRGKCQVDAYFSTGNKLADDQKLLQENIIPLMESAWAFTFSKINVGVSVQYGGSAVYDYPEEVIRETINNALAHRDYASDGFCILEIKNNEHIEIRNPGTFSQEQIVYFDDPAINIRRIIPIPKARNANIAEVLKIYKRWEGRGIGMATLVNYSLSNHIDVPYYRLYPGNQIGLFISKGKVLDEKTTDWLKSFYQYILRKTQGIELTEEQQVVLAYLYKSEKLNANEKYTVNLTPDNNHYDAISNLLSWNLIEKLPQSTAEWQLFKIDPVLKKDDFTIELRNIFGSDYDALSKTLKDILQAIYLHDEYGSSAETNATLIGNYLYRKSQKSLLLDLRELDNFKRKIRTDINKLERKNFIFKVSGNRFYYKINTTYLHSPYMYDYPGEFT